MTYLLCPSPIHPSVISCHVHRQSCPAFARQAPILSHKLGALRSAVLTPKVLGVHHHVGSLFDTKLAGVHGAGRRTVWMDIDEDVRIEYVSQSSIPPPAPPQARMGHSLVRGLRVHAL
jgi:hypothetical protein